MFGAGECVCGDSGGVSRKEESSTKGMDDNIISGR